MADAGLSFTDALKQYFAKNAGGATRELYEGLFPHMESLGFKVERPTRSGKNPDGSKRLSSDKIVDSSTGALYDIIRGVDDVTGAGPWVLGVPKDWAYWVNGKASRTPIGGGPSGAAPAATAPSGPTVLGSPLDGSNPYAAGMIAASRQRTRARAGGRSSTVLGGFAPGKPATRPSVLGGY